MNPPKKDWREWISPYVKRIYPYTQIAERVVQVAVHLEKPSVFGLAGLASVGINALRDMTDGSSSVWNTQLLLSQGETIKAFKEAGASVKTERNGDGEIQVASLNGIELNITGEGWITYTVSGGTAEILEWMRQIFDRSLPNGLSITKGSGRPEQDAYKSTALKLTSFRSSQGQAVLEAVRPFINANKQRCILLDGKPGVGKSTMAQEIARDLGVGRTILLDGCIVGTDRQAGNFEPSRRGPMGGAALEEALMLLSPGVIIIDDADKISISLNNMEILRRYSRLVILTANNGSHDEVMDGSLIRPGRVDETFSIVSERPETRNPPFDRLSDAEWEMVRDWPIAYLNEVESRLSLRPGMIRLDDLKERVGRKVKSGKKLYDSEDIFGEDD